MYITSKFKIFYKNSYVVSEMISFIFYCLSKVFYFFNQSLFHFVRSVIKTVVPEIKFSPCLIGVLLETRFKTESSFKEKF
jgi:hypothetical protein